MEIIIEAIKKLVGKDDVETKIIGVRPGDKLHEDMLANTELPFTYQPDDKLLTVIPQYTKNIILILKNMMEKNLIHHYIIMIM